MAMHITPAGVEVWIAIPASRKLQKSFGGKNQMTMGPIDFAAVFARLGKQGAREEIVPLGGVDVRMVRVAGGGEGRWDHHGHSAETVVVWSGDFTVEFRDQTLELGAGQCCVVAVNAEHRGKSCAGAEIILFQTREA